MLCPLRLLPILTPVNKKSCTIEIYPRSVLALKLVYSRSVSVPYYIPHVV